MLCSLLSCSAPGHTGDCATGVNTSPAVAVPDAPLAEISQYTSDLLTAYHLPRPTLAVCLALYATAVTCCAVAQSKYLNHIYKGNC